MSENIGDTGGEILLLSPSIPDNNLIHLGNNNMLEIGDSLVKSVLQQSNFCTDLDVIDVKEKTNEEVNNEQEIEGLKGEEEIMKNLLDESKDSPFSSDQESSSDNQLDFEEVENNNENANNEENNNNNEDNELINNNNNNVNNENNENIEENGVNGVNEQNADVNDILILEPLPNNVNIQGPPKEECSICLETAEMYALRCYHKFCRPCLEEYFRTRINNGLVLVVPCPNHNCGEPCVEHDIEMLVGPADFERYQKFHYLASVRAEPTIRWCPTIDCGNPVCGDPSSPSFPCLTCTKCNSQFCYDCNQPWHAELTCKQNFKKLKKAGQLNSKDEKWKKKNKTRKCAQCRIDIYKDKGCNHMICAGCGYQFCWVCMKPFTPDHYIFGSCAGLQFSKYPIAKKRLKKAGKIILIGGAIVILVPTTVVIVGAVVIPALIITVPIYGGYRLIKHIKRKRREKRRRNRSTL